MMSFSNWDSISPQSSASFSRRRPSADSRSFFSRCSTPKTPFIGVRISWLILARNWLLASAAARAASRASTSSVTFWLMPITSQVSGLAPRTPRQDEWMCAQRSAGGSR